MRLAQAVDYADAEGEQDPLDADAAEVEAELEPLEGVEGEEAAVSMEEAAPAAEQQQNGTAEPAAEPVAAAAPAEEAKELRYPMVPPRLLYHLAVCSCCNHQNKGAARRPP